MQKKREVSKTREISQSLSSTTRPIKMPVYEQMRKVIRSSKMLFKLAAIIEIMMSHLSFSFNKTRTNTHATWYQHSLWYLHNNVRCFICEIQTHTHALYRDRCQDRELAFQPRQQYFFALIWNSNFFNHEKKPERKK